MHIEEDIELAENRSGDSDQENRSVAGVKRRAFLTAGMAAGVGAAVAASRTTVAADATPADLIKWDIEVDVVIVGAGATGLPAAIAARDAGATVLVVEANFDVGGKMMLSGGRIRLGGGNRLQREQGVEDSEERVFQEWIQHDRLASRFSDRELVRVFADQNLSTFEFLEKNGVTWHELSAPSPAEPVARGVVSTEWPIRDDLANATALTRAGCRKRARCRLAAQMGERQSRRSAINPVTDSGLSSFG